MGSLGTFRSSTGSIDRDSAHLKAKKNIMRIFYDFYLSMKNSLVCFALCVLIKNFKIFFSQQPIYLVY